MVILDVTDSNAHTHRIETKVSERFAYHMEGKEFKVGKIGKCDCTRVYKDNDGNVIIEAIHTDWRHR